MQVRMLCIGAAVGMMVGLPADVGAQPMGRLLVPGPLDNGQVSNEIHEYDLATGTMTTFGPAGGFSQSPWGVSVCPDGYLYVALLGDGGVYKLDPLTGESLDILAIPTGQQTIGLLCLPNGNLLLFDDDQVGVIKQYAPDATDLGVWANPGPKIIRSMRLTPDGGVAFLFGHPGTCATCPGDTSLLEYDVGGSFLREVIATTTDGMYGFRFSSETEILVTHSDSHCIKRYDWTTTPATFVSDFVCDPSRIEATDLVVHPTDGAVYAGDIGGGCIWAWDASGAPLYGDQPLGCYGPPFYHGELTILGGAAIPTVSEWGIIAMVVLLLAGGAVVFRGRRMTRDAAARGGTA